MPEEQEDESLPPIRAVYVIKVTVRDEDATKTPPTISQVEATIEDDFTLGYIRAEEGDDPGIQWEYANAKAERTDN